jgi:hypothetical protein
MALLWWCYNGVMVLLWCCYGVVMVMVWPAQPVASRKQRAESTPASRGAWRIGSASRAAEVREEVTVEVRSEVKTEMRVEVWSREHTCLRTAAAASGETSSTAAAKVA